MNVRPTKSTLPPLPEGYTYMQKNVESYKPKKASVNDWKGDLSYMANELYRSVSSSSSPSTNHYELTYTQEAAPTILSTDKDFIDNVFKTHNIVKVSDLQKNGKYYMVELSDQMLTLYLVTITKTGSIEYSATRILRNGSMNSITPSPGEGTYNKIFFETVPKTSSGLNSTRRRKQRQNKSRRLRSSRRNYRK